MLALCQHAGFLALWSMKTVLMMRARASACGATVGHIMRRDRNRSEALYSVQDLVGEIAGLG